MKLYHIHKSNKYDDLYEVGNTFEVGKNNNTFRNRSLDLSASILTNTYEKDGKTYNKYDDFESYFKQHDLKSLDTSEAEKITSWINYYVHNSKLAFRELILEEVRYKKFSNLPSRYSCMWLTDEECLDKWMESLSSPCGENVFKIFEIEADGNIFVSRDSLLPKIYVPHDIMYEEAYKYWNPLDIDDSLDKEYLFEGNVKILRRVK